MAEQVFPVTVRAKPKPKEPTLLEALMAAGKAGLDQTALAGLQATAGAVNDPARALIELFKPGAAPLAVNDAMARPAADQLVRDWGGVKPAMQAGRDASALIDILSGKEKSVPFAPAYAGQKASDALTNAGTAVLDASTFLPTGVARSKFDDVPSLSKFDEFAAALDAKNAAAIADNSSMGVGSMAQMPRSGGPSFGRDPTRVARAMSSQDPTQLSMGFGSSGKDGERSLAQILSDTMKGGKSAAPQDLLNGARGSDPEQFKRVVDSLSSASHGDVKSFARELGIPTNADKKELIARIEDQFWHRHGLQGRVDKIDEMAQNAKSWEARRDEALAAVPQADIDALRALLGSLEKQPKSAPVFAPPTPLDDVPFSPGPPPKDPTTLGMGFGSGGKDGQRSLAQIIGDAFKGKKPEPNPLDQFTPPTSIDDIFTGGGPRGPREMTGGSQNPAGMESSFFNDPRFNGPQEPVPYNPESGFGGLDARLGQGKKAEPLVGYRALTQPYDENKAYSPQWFSDDPEVARTYIQNDRGGFRANSQMIKANLDFKNPKIVDAQGQVWDQLSTKMDTNQVAREARAAGHDGVIFKNVRDPGKYDDSIRTDGATNARMSTVYAALKPSDNIRFPFENVPSAADKNAKTLSEALAKRAKPPGYDDWSPEWRAAYDKGLPMDTASRMARAREQGFNVDEPFYHGTRADFSEFAPNAPQEGMGLGVYASNKPEVATHYSGNTEGSRLMELLAKTGDIQKVTPESYGRGLEQYLESVGFKGDPYSPEAVQLYADELARQGNSGIQMTHELLAFDPANIRSTSAAFDPANAGKPTLLGMGAPFEGKGKPPGYNDWAPEWRAAYDKGLPMDTASRMARAREQGFDVNNPWYRGQSTGSDLEPGWYRSFFSSSPELAGRWSSGVSDAGGQVFPVFAKYGKNVTVDAKGKPYNDLPFPKELRGGSNQKRITSEGFGNALDQSDFNTGIIKNVDEAVLGGTHNGQKIWDGNTVADDLIVPGHSFANIRSTSAAFDPANAGKPTLLGMGRAAVDSDLIKLLMAYGAFGGMSAGALATMDAQKHQQGGM